MKIWLIIALACFWAAVTHAIWGFYPVTIGGAVIGAIAGALAIAIFGVVDEMERDEMDYDDMIRPAPNEPVVKTHPEEFLCWEGCGRKAPFPDVLCPQCRARYPWLSQ